MIMDSSGFALTRRRKGSSPSRSLTTRGRLLKISHAQVLPHTSRKEPAYFHTVALHLTAKGRCSDYLGFLNTIHHAGDSRIVSGNMRRPHHE